MVEQEKILSVLDATDKEVREEKLCDYYKSNLFMNENIIELLEQNIDKSRCTGSGLIPQDIPDSTLKIVTDEQKKEMLKKCWEEKELVTGTCSAYRKKKFFYGRNRSCTINLTAGEGKFFVQDKVFVKSEYRRRPISLPVVEEMKAETDEEKHINRFSGDISCKTSGNLGSWCKVAAEVEAFAYKKECAEVQNLLKKTIEQKYK